MQRRELNLLLDWVIFVASVVTFSTGLILLIHFHMGDGAFAVSALGQSKLFWLNLHRLSAAVVAAGAATHVGFHWRAFRSRLTNIVAKRTKRRINLELIMYTVFLIAALTGLVAWLVLEGSSPLFGPAFIGRASGARHPWVDTHHMSSLLALLLIVHHVAHRWGFMTSRPRPVFVARD